MAANPGTRRREREIETRAENRTLGFLLGSKMNLSSPVSRKKKKRKALDTSPSLSSTDFVIPRRSPPKCLLGWKIARVLDDGRMDLSFETKGLLMNRVIGGTLEGFYC